MCVRAFLLSLAWAESTMGCVGWERGAATVCTLAVMLVDQSPLRIHVDTGVN